MARARVGWVRGRAATSVRRALQRIEGRPGTRDVRARAPSGRARRTGSVARARVLSPAAVAARIVLDADGRAPVPTPSHPPFRMICSLVGVFPSGTMRGTGWLVGSNAIVTAGHCLLDPGSGEWAESVIARPGRSPDDSEPFGSFSVRTEDLHVPDRWKASFDEAWDIGVLIVNERTNDGEVIGDALGAFAVASASDEQLHRHEVEVAGYPTDRAGGKQLVRAKGSIEVVGTNFLVHDVDTYGGESGSPLVASFDGTEVPTVWGVHLGDDTVSGGAGRRNAALRMRPELVSLIREIAS